MVICFEEGHIEGSLTFVRGKTYVNYYTTDLNQPLKSTTSHQGGARWNGGSGGTGEECTKV